jgi:anti-sigma regulatory factor (Ser/Thr protein kinase)
MAAPDAGSFVHEALLYRDEEQFLDGVVPFVREGLAADEAVLVAVPQDGIELMRRPLGEQADRVRFLNMTEAGRNPGRIIPGVLLAFAGANSDRSVRIVGEPVWKGRSDVEYPACVQHEALINTVFAGRRASILCPYDAEALDPQAIEDAHRTHPIMLDAGSRCVSEEYEDPVATAKSFDLPLPDPPGPVAAHRFDVHGLATTRRLVSAFATDAGLSEVKVADLVLAVNELTTNCIAHATGHGTLRIWQDDHDVVCEVHDRGRLDDPLAGRVPPRPNSRGGYGLVMVNLLCDLVRIHATEDGTTIRVHVAP